MGGLVWRKHVCLPLEPNEDEQSGADSNCLRLAPPSGHMRAEFDAQLEINPGLNSSGFTNETKYNVTK